VDVLRLPEDMATQMIEHAQAEYPKEACGMVLGPDGEARELHQLVNVDDNPVMRYNVDPRELKRLTDYMYEKEWDVVAIWHSHTGSPAFPSKTDVELAGYPQAAYVLVSLMDRQYPVLRAFRIIEGKITEMDVVRDGEGVR
jgi:[CysO sulfur-carrier protein]-S-L-cysteine hydrolase